MRDEQTALKAKHLDERTDVIGESKDIVAAFGVGGAGVAAQVGRVDAALRQQFHNMSPAHPSFRKAVNAEHGRRVCRPGDGDMEAYAIGCDLPVFDVCGHQGAPKHGVGF